MTDWEHSEMAVRDRGESSEQRKEVGGGGGTLWVCEGSAFEVRTWMDFQLGECRLVALSLDPTRPDSDTISKRRVLGSVR